MGLLIFDKPFKTYDEQIDILSNKYGLEIKNRKFAVTAIQSLTYYDLINGYKEIFMKDDRFLPDTSIEYIYSLYIIDKHIQSLLFEYSTIVENAFKSKLAYVIAENFGVCEHDYLDPENYFKSNNKIYFSNVQEACFNIFSGKNPIPQPTKHYCTYHNHIPPWILFKNLSFSKSINLFQLLKPNEKYQLVKLLVPSDKVSYTDSVTFIINSLNIIRSYRNKIAHNLKFLTYKSPTNSISPKTITKLIPKTLITWKDINKNHRGVNDIYAYMLCLLYLLQDPFLRSLFAGNLLNAFSGIEKTNNQKFHKAFSAYYQITNVPENFPVRLRNYLPPTFPKV